MLQKPDILTSNNKNQMDITIFNVVGPQVLFFLIFFLVFSILELILIFILNRFELAKWKFMIDVVIRSQVEHGRVIHYVMTGSIVLIAGMLVYVTPIVSILGTGTKEVKIFASVLIITMILIYATTTRKFAKLTIEKLIHKYIYIIVSLIFFVVIMLIVNESYGVYRAYINKTFINPTIQKVQVNLEESKKQNLLTQFRIMARKGECIDKDYSKEQGDGVLNFVYVQTDPEFITSDKNIDVNDPNSYLRGKQCTNGKDTFLLTPYGNWYWVAD